MKPTAQIVNRITARLWARLSAQLILIMAFVGLAYFLVYFTLNSSLAFKAFDEAVNDQFRGDIGWGQIVWGPLPWELRLLDPVLIGADGREVAWASEMHFENIDLAGLSQGRISVEGARIINPSVHLRERAHPESFDAMGKPTTVLNISEMFWPPVLGVDKGEPSARLIIDIRQITIEGGHFELDLEAAHLRADALDVTQAEFFVDISNTDSMSIHAEHLQTKRGRFTLRLAGTKHARDSAPSDRFEQAFDTLELKRYVWLGERFHAQSLNLELGQDTVKLTGLGMDLGRPDLPALWTKFDLEIQDIATHLSPWGVEGISGPVRLRGSTQGELDSSAVSFEASGERLQVQDHTLGDWRLEGRKSPEDVVYVSTLQGEVLDGSISGRFEVDLNGEGSAGGEVFFRDTRFEKAAPQIPSQTQAFFAGPSTGSIFFDGHRIFTPQITGGVAVRADLGRTGGRVYGLGRTARLDVVARWGEPVLDLRRLQFRSGNYDLDTRGDIDFDTEQLDLVGSLHAHELGDALRGFGVPATGEARLAFRATGDLRDPCVTSRGPLRVNQFTFAPWPAADVKGRVRYCKGVLQLEKTGITTKIGSATVEGRVDLRPAGKLSLKYTAKGIRLDALPLGVDIAGRIDTRGRVGGTLRRPTLWAKGRVTRPRFEAFDAERVDFDAQYKGSRVEVAKLALHRGGKALISASGFVDLRRKRYDGRVDISRVELDLVNEFVETPLPIEGALSLHLEGQGTFANPAGTGRLNLHGLAFDELSLGDADLQLSASEGIVNISGDLFETFSLEAALPVDPKAPLPATVGVRFTELKVERFLPDLEESGLSATLTGEVSAQLNLFEGELLHARTRLTELSARLGEIELRNIGDVILSRAGALGAIQVDQLALEWPGEPGAPSHAKLSVAGTISDELDLGLDGWVEFSALQPFMVDVFTVMDGRLSLDLDLRGTPAALRPEGLVVLERSSFVPRSSTIGSEIQILQPVRFEVLSEMGPMGPNAESGVFSVHMPSFSPQGDQLVPNQFLIRRDGADLEVTEVSGSFVEFQPVLLDVEVEGEELSVRIPRVLRGAVDLSPLHFRMWQVQKDRSQQTYMRLSGDVRLLRGEFIQNIQADGLGQGLGRNFTGTAKARSLSAFESSPILKRLALDLRIRTQNDFYVRNNVSLLRLDLELETDLRMTGFLYTNPGDAEDEQLQLNGYAATLPESKVYYSGRAFEVLLGRVDFGSGDSNVTGGGGDFMTGQFESSHTFRIRVDEGDGSGFASDVRLEEVTLSAEARMPTRNSELKLEPRLSSSSGLSNFEIATLMLTGQLPSKVTGAATAQSAGGALFGGIIDLIGKPFEEALKLDQLNLTPDAAGALYIDAEKVLSRRLRLYARAPIGSENDEQIFGLESQLNNVLIGEITNEQVSNLSSTSFRLRLHLSWD